MIACPSNPDGMVLLRCERLNGNDAKMMAAKIVSENFDLESPKPRLHVTPNLRLNVGEADRREMSRVRPGSTKNQLGTYRLG